MTFQSYAGCGEGRTVPELLLEGHRESPAGKANGKEVPGPETAYTNSI